MDENPYKSPETRGAKAESGKLSRRLFRSLTRIILAVCGAPFAYIAAWGIVNSMTFWNWNYLMFEAGSGLIAFAFFYGASRIPR